MDSNKMNFSEFLFIKEWNESAIQFLAEAKRKNYTTGYVPEEFAQCVLFDEFDEKFINQLKNWKSSNPDPAMAAIENKEMPTKVRAGIIARYALIRDELTDELKSNLLAPTEKGNTNRTIYRTKAYGYFKDVNENAADQPATFVLKTKGRTGIIEVKGVKTYLKHLSDKLGNCVHPHKPGTTVDIRAQLKLLDNIDRFIKNGKFNVHFKVPKISELEDIDKKEFVDLITDKPVAVKTANELLSLIMDKSRDVSTPFKKGEGNLSTKEIYALIVKGVNSGVNKYGEHESKDVYITSAIRSLYQKLGQLERMDDARPYIAAIGRNSVKFLLQPKEKQARQLPSDKEGISFDVSSDPETSSKGMKALSGGKYNNPLSAAIAREKEEEKEREDSEFIKSLKDEPLKQGLGSEYGQGLRKALGKKPLSTGSPFEKPEPSQPKKDRSDLLSRMKSASKSLAPVSQSDKNKKDQLDDIRKRLGLDSDEKLPEPPASIGDFNTPEDIKDYLQWYKKKYRDKLLA